MYNKYKIESQKSQRSAQQQRPGSRKNLCFSIFFLLLIFLMLPQSALAQCAMCRAAIESEGNSATAEAVNDGIIYLMVIPYILVGAIGIAIYRMRRK